MAKESSEKKWLVLLVVLIAIILVVELLSLNVLYGLANSSSLPGQLATTKPNPSSGNPHSHNYDPCEACGSSWAGCVKGCGRDPTQDCLLGCDASYASCMYDNNC